MFLTLVSLEQHHLKGTNRDTIQLENYEWSGFKYSSKNSIFGMFFIFPILTSAFGVHIPESPNVLDFRRKPEKTHEHMQTGGIWTQDFLPVRLQGFKTHHYAAENKNLWNAGISSFLIVKPQYIYLTESPL